MEWTPRVNHRVELAKALLNHPARLAAAGIKPADLEEIVQAGAEAEAADSDQAAEIAENQVLRSGRKTSAVDLKKEEDELRDRLPAVVGDLKRDGHTQQADWLSVVSFKRFRIVELGGAQADDVPDDLAREGGAPEDEAPAPERVRKERQDQVTRFYGTAGFCRVVLVRKREVIVDKLAERGFDRARLEALGSGAKALADLGRNHQRAAEATAREEAAVARQTARWKEVRRMLKKACAGDADLALLLAKC